MLNTKDAQERIYVILTHIKLLSTEATFLKKKLKCYDNYCCEFHSLLWLDNNIVQSIGQYISGSVKFDLSCFVTVALVRPRSQEHGFVVK